MAKVKDSQNKSEWHGFKTQTCLFFFFFLHFVNLSIAKTCVIFQRNSIVF